jgi:hypothetical protein
VIVGRLGLQCATSDGRLSYFGDEEVSSIAISDHSYEGALMEGLPSARKRSTYSLNVGTRAQSLFPG